MTHTCVPGFQHVGAVGSQRNSIPECSTVKNWKARLTCATTYTAKIRQNRMQYFSSSHHEHYPCAKRRGVKLNFGLACLLGMYTAATKRQPRAARASQKLGGRLKQSCSFSRPGAWASLKHWKWLVCSLKSHCPSRTLLRPSRCCLLQLRLCQAMSSRGPAAT